MGVLNFVLKGVADINEKECKGLTTMSFPVSLHEWNIGLYHNQQELGENHVFDEVIFLRV